MYENRSPTRSRGRESGHFTSFAWLLPTLGFGLPTLTRRKVRHAHHVPACRTTLPSVPKLRGALARAPHYHLSHACDIVPLFRLDRCAMSQSGASDGHGATDVRIIKNSAQVNPGPALIHPHCLSKDRLIIRYAFSHELVVPFAQTFKATLIFDGR
jgi:hypothetical protein